MKSILQQYRPNLSTITSNLIGNLYFEVTLFEFFFIEFGLPPYNYNDSNLKGSEETRRMKFSVKLKCNVQETEYMNKHDELKGKFYIQTLIYDDQSGFKI